MPGGEQFARYYPGLIPQEADLWRWWLRDHETEWGRFVYNVHVGEGVDASPHALSGDPKLQQKLAARFKAATQRKIDAVGLNPKAIELFEVEARPGMRAYGQALAYPALYVATFPTRVPVNVTVICDRLSQDMFTVFSSAKIRLYVRNPTPLQYAFVVGTPPKQI